MCFSKRLLNEISNINSKYDMIAYCYWYLLNTVENQIVFLGEYIEINNDTKKDNPNFGMLSQFAVNIKDFFAKHYALDIYEKTKSEMLDLIISAEDKLRCFGDESMNYATIPFFILKGLDLYFQDYTYETYGKSPMNTFCSDFCLVYIHNDDSIFDEIAHKKDYAKKIRKTEIRNYFKYIIFFEMCELPLNYGVPQLATLQKEKTALKGILETKKLKMALIPVLCEKWFDFNITRGALFEIEYHKKQLKDVGDRVILLLKWAIECKANIIVFPEYVCSEEIQRKIHDTLYKLSNDEPEKLKDLLFVVAGTSWTEDSNNVCYIYDEEGEILGKVYKYSAYDNYKDGIRYVERLQNPGKEITLVKVPGIGVFQIEICRNVSENEFCLKLAKVFNIQFLLITAWSSSVNNGFKKQIDAIVSSNHRTCTAMSNCCAAFSDCKEFRTQIGLVAAPQKNNTLIEANCQFVEREKQQCIASCDEGCIFEIDFDFCGEEQNDVVIRREFKKLEIGTRNMYNKS